MRSVLSLLLSFFLLTSVEAQEAGVAKKPGLGPKAAKAEELIAGRFAPDAPKLAQVVRQKLGKLVRAKSEAFATRFGFLSVHKGVSAKALRGYARSIEAIKGVRQALTDTPRRMILCIFDTAPANYTPEACAGDLEELRRRFEKSQAKPLSGSGLGLGESDEELAEPSKLKKPGARRPSKPKRSVSPPAAKAPQPAPAPSEGPIPSMEVVRRARVSPLMTGREALGMWTKEPTKERRAVALVTARAVLKKSPRDAEAGVVIALYYLAIGKKLKAYRNMRTVTRMRPDNARYHEIYARALRAMGLEARALEEDALAAQLRRTKK